MTQNDKLNHLFVILESLEERIEHYAKKKRIEIIDDETKVTS